MNLWAIVSAWDHHRPWTVEGFRLLSRGLIRYYFGLHGGQIDGQSQSAFENFTIYRVRQIWSKPLPARLVTWDLKFSAGRDIRELGIYILQLALFADSVVRRRRLKRSVNVMDKVVADLAGAKQVECWKFRGLVLGTREAYRLSRRMMDYWSLLQLPVVNWWDKLYLFPRLQRK